MMSASAGRDLVLAILIVLFVAAISELEPRTLIQTAAWLCVLALGGAIVVSVLAAQRLSKGASHDDE